VEDVAKTKCIKLDDCPYGMTGQVTWNVGTSKMDTSACKTDTNDCHDEDQIKGACNDCNKGFIGSVDWNYVTQKWDTSQCLIQPCPVTTETAPDCNSCPEFHTGKPDWDDLFNEWTGCVASEFGFSFGAAASASASWAMVGEVEVADLQLMEMFHVTETKTAETLHIANAQYDAIRDKWVCDEGFAGDTCQERLCPETVAFTSGTDAVPRVYLSALYGTRMRVRAPVLPSTINIPTASAVVAVRVTTRPPYVSASQVLPGLVAGALPARTAAVDMVFA
jgi:hypothetical protein